MPRRPATAAHYLLIIAGLLTVFFLIGWTAWRDKSPTFDEPLHFSAAWLQTHYGDFRCDPEDPPLWKYYVALGTSKSLLQIPTAGLIWDDMLTDRGVEGLFFKQIFYYTPENNAIGALADARVRMLFLAVILAAGIAWWAWRLSGPAAAAIAVAAFGFDPNFLAHAPLVKNDVPIALILFAFMAAVWLAGQRATLPRCLAVALTMAAAVTVKFSGVLTIPILVLILLARALLPGPWPCRKWTARTRVHRLAVAAGIFIFSCGISYVFIWACYGFRYGPALNPAQTFDFTELPRIAARHEAFAAYHAFTLTNEQLREWYAHWQPGLLFRTVLRIGEHHLLPQTWVEGFLFTTGTAPGREAFLFGSSAMAGRWYYFPIVIAVKTPLATLVAFVISAAYWTFKGFPPPSVFRGRAGVGVDSRAASEAPTLTLRRNTGGGEESERQFRFWNILALTAMPAIYLAVAMTSDLNLGIRHILPIYPFLFIFLGITAADAVVKFRKPAMILISILILGLIVETAAAYPDYIPFFNIAAAGWQNGPRLLGDSNVDWGQDLPALAQWQRKNPQYQLYLNYFGSADPRYYGIHYVNLPGSNAPDDQTTPNSGPPVYAISGNASHFPWLSPESRDFYARLQSRPPIAVLGHCIYLYN